MRLNANFEKEIESVKAVLTQERDKRRDTKKAVQEVEKKMSTMETRAQEVTFQALAKFRAYQEFEDEVAEASVIAYRVGFEDCMTALRRLHAKLDLSGLQPNEAFGEDEGDKAPKTIE